MEGRGLVVNPKDSQAWEDYQAQVDIFKCDCGTSWFNSI